MRKKIALSKSIRISLAEKLNTFKAETGVSIESVSIAMLDVTTAESDMPDFIPGGVDVRLAIF